MYGWTYGFMNVSMVCVCLCCVACRVLLCALGVPVSLPRTGEWRTRSLSWVGHASAPMHLLRALYGQQGGRSEWLGELKEARNCDKCTHENAPSHVRVSGMLWCRVPRVRLYISVFLYVECTPIESRRQRHCVAAPPSQRESERASSARFLPTTSRVA